MCKKTSTMSQNKSAFHKLFDKEFKFDRIDEFTGKKLYTKNVDHLLPGQEKETFKHEYRGITLYIKEVIESGLAFILILLFLFLFGVFCYRFIITNEAIFDPNNSSPTEIINFYDFLKNILNLAGGFLILDSLLLIAALISSPGIDETIDSLSVTIAGVLLIILGQKVDEMISRPELVLAIILPLSLIVIGLIFTKHALKKLNRGEKVRYIEGMDEENLKK